MSHFLTTIIDETRKNSHYMIENQKAALSSGKGSVTPTDLFRQEQGYSSYNANLGVVEEQLKHNTGRVFSAVGAIARRLAGQPIRVGKIHRSSGSTNSVPRRSFPKKDFLPSGLKDFEGQIEILPDHPLNNVFQDPNPIMVGYDLKGLTAAWLELSGQADWLIVMPQDRIGNASFRSPGYEDRITIWPLPPNWVSPVHDGGLFTSWKIQPTDAVSPIYVPSDRIFHAYYPDPAEPLCPFSPLQAIARSIAADEAISEAQIQTFMQGAFPGLLFTIGRHPDVAGSPGERPFLSAEQHAQIVAWIEHMYRGTQRYNRPLILDALIEKVEHLTGNSAREMDFMRSAGLTERQIDEGFGVNPIVRGRVEGANRATSIMATRNFLENCVNPKAHHLSECMAAWLLPIVASNEPDLVIYIEPAVTEDPEMDVMKQETMISGGFAQFNELRIMNGLPPDDRFKDYYVTKNGPISAASILENSEEETVETDPEIETEEEAV